MIYNFDEVIDRRNTDALKLEALQPRWGRFPYGWRIWTFALLRL